MRPVHETHLEIPFPITNGVAVIRVPKDGLTPVDAQRMADMVAILVAGSTPGENIVNSREDKL